MTLRTGLSPLVYLAFLWASPAFAVDPLAAGFAHPPNDRRMATYWWIFGPAWTRPEIRRELGVLKSAGIGGVLIYPLYPYEVENPAKGIHNQNYLSPEFLDTLGYALTTANEMGLSADLVMGTGWPYGGPQIPPELSPERIYAETTEVRGAPGEKITLPLRRPADARVVSVQLVPRDPASAAAPVELTGQGAADSVTFVAPAGEWQMMTFLEGPTLARHKVAYAAAGAGGNVIDHLDKRAVELYLKTVCEKLAEAGKGRIRAMYSPSFEVYGTCWTSSFPDEFRRRRGYDLRPHLAALFRQQPDTPHIRYDYWETVSELANQNYLKTISDWCHAHGFRFQSESYGEPPVTQASYSFTDFPMGEEYDWKEFNMVRWTSSAAHFFNHPIISDEAYTWLTQPSRYDETLEDLKRTTDAIFVSGANRIVAHGYAYSPPAAGVPGWGYYAGTMFTEHQTWWPYFHYLTSYVHRASYLLAQGSPVADVLVYLPEGDVYAEHAPGALPLAWWVERKLDRHQRRMADMGIPNGVYDYTSELVNTVITSGYSLDGIDHSVLAATGTAEHGRFRIGEASYPIVILPGVRGLPLSDLERIAEFCRSGGTVITTLEIPKLAYAYRDRDRNAARFNALRAELYGGMDESKPLEVRRVGRGRSLFAKDERESLKKALEQAEPPDISAAGGLPEMGFVHRRGADHDIYFLANFTTAKRELRVSFRAGARTPEIWDPMSGRISVAGGFHYEGGRTAVDLALESYDSAFVVFGREHRAPPTAAPPAAKPLEAPIPFTNSWKLRWESSGAQPVEMRRLKSWTEFPDARYFSGRGTYETAIDVPAAYLAPGTRVLLNMGDVKNTAEVWVNGQNDGVAWKRPYVVDITRSLHLGSNAVRIDVTNLLINAVLRQPTKDYSEIEATYGTKIPKPREKEFVKNEPLPSGLLGPVELEQQPAKGGERRR
ncbi:MAG TPA: glycosyl hydrolase [Bryobacteraceae bacterium]|nr:glycosyl hydrolase [Bryobacteraceae bacterium]